MQEMVKVPERPDPDLATAIVRRWRLVVALGFVGIVVGLIVSLTMPRVYQANASLMVGEFSAGDVTINDIRGSQTLAATYADLARREPVMKAVVSDLHLGVPWRSLVDRVHVRTMRENPQVIVITAEDGKPETAEAIAGSVAKHVIAAAGAGATDELSFVQKQLDSLRSAIESTTARLADLRRQLQSARGSDREAIQQQIDALEPDLMDQQKSYLEFRSNISPASATAVRQLDSAHASPDPIRPNVRFNTVVAGLVGVLLGIAYVYARNGRRRGVEAEADVRRRVTRAWVDGRMDVDERIRMSRGGTR